LVHAFDALPVVLRNDVAGLNAGLLSRTVRRDPGHLDAGFLGEFQLFRPIAIDLLNPDAEKAAGARRNGGGRHREILADPQNGGETRDQSDFRKHAPVAPFPSTFVPATFSEDRSLRSKYSDLTLARLR